MTTRCALITILCVASAATASKDAPKLYDEMGFSPLHRAVYEDNFDEVTRLLDAKADPNSKDLQEGATPLHWASDGKNSALIVNTLISHQATVTTPDHQGNTALHWAARAGNLNAVELLVESGADKDYQNSEGDTPLHLAIQAGFYDIARYLTHNRADPNIKNGDGDTPLHLALDTLNPGLVASLIENGDVAIKDAYNHTALRRALLQKDTVEKRTIIRMLLTHGSTANEIRPTKDNSSAITLLKEISKELENNRKKAAEHLQKFMQAYCKEDSSIAFFHIAEALRSMDFVPSFQIANLTAQDDEKFNKGKLTTFITNTPTLSARTKTQALFRQLYLVYKQDQTDEAILAHIRPYAKLLPLHYKIHIMPRARRVERTKQSHLPYCFDRVDAASLIAQIVRLFLTDRIFRNNIETFKVMRLPAVSYKPGEVGPFIVIYPRMLPGAALTVARLLDEELIFQGLNKDFPLYPTPRYNAKFNETDTDSGLFYAMGDGDRKSNPRLNKILFDESLVLLNDTITTMAGYTGQLKLTPEGKRKRVIIEQDESKEDKDEKEEKIVKKEKK